MALMQSQEANNQNLLNEQSLMHLMKHLVSLLEDLRQQIESEDSRYQDSLKRTSKTPQNSQENDVYEQYSRHRDDEDFEEDEDEDEMTPQERYKQALDKVKAGGSAEPLPFDQSKWEHDFSDSDSEGFRRRRRRIAKSVGRHRCVHNVWVVYAGVAENDAADESTRARPIRLGSGQFDATRDETNK